MWYKYTPGTFIPISIVIRRQQLKQIHIRLSELLHRELRIQAAIKEQTLQDYVVDAIRDKIALDQANYGVDACKGGNE